MVTQINAEDYANNTEGYAEKRGILRRSTLLSAQSPFLQNMNLNKVFLVGRLTDNPEQRTMPNGRSVSAFRIATNRIWTDQDSGEKQEQAEFHNVVAFGKLADTCNQYLTKGQLILVEGRIQTRSWEDTHGTRKYRTEIIAENIQMGPRPGGKKAEDIEEIPEENPEETKTSSAEEEAQKENKDENKTKEPEEEIDIEDIPF